MFYDIQSSDKDMVIQLDHLSMSYISGEALLASYSYNNQDDVNENKEEAGIHTEQ
ncbi:hypothetical protein [Paenibacillus crassostreae]|uniref:hypothetical protein n=1 Tax=Paenibacillus crassostreae TaxID=1763538 RepID=UPI000A9FB440|nr:hypothetical protein [Paenibacillus crassostreae]